MTTTIIELGTVLCAFCELTRLLLLIISWRGIIIVTHPPTNLQMRNLVGAIVTFLPELCFLSIHALIWFTYPPLCNTYHQMVPWMLILFPVLGEAPISLMVTPSHANECVQESSSKVFSPWHCLAIGTGAEQACDSIRLKACWGKEDWSFILLRGILKANISFPLNLIVNRYEVRSCYRHFAIMMQLEVTSGLTSQCSYSL